MTITLLCGFIGQTANATDLDQAIPTSDYGIRINPIPLIFGGLFAETPIRVNQKIAIAPMFAYMNFEFMGISMKMWQAGARLDYHINEVFKDGVYVSLLTSFGSFDSSITDKDVVYSTQGSGFGASVMLGYLWRWEHFTTNLGIGYVLASGELPKYKSSTGEVYGGSQSSNPSATFDISLGWAF